VAGGSASRRGFHSSTGSLLILQTESPTLTSHVSALEQLETIKEVIGIAAD